VYPREKDKVIERQFGGDDAELVVEFPLRGSPDACAVVSTGEGA
jgi:hypothetical protein